MGDHRTYPAAERVVVERVREGMALRVYENSRTVHTEAILTQDEAGEIAQQLTFWPPFEEVAGPDVPAMPDFWPPKPGEQWRDSKDGIWFVMGTGKLVCLADDLNEVDGFGPTPHDAAELHARSSLRRVMAAVDGWDVEVPF